MATFKNTSTIPDKESNVLTNATFTYVIYRSYKLLKTIRFWSTLYKYICTSQNHNTHNRFYAIM